MKNVLTPLALSVLIAIGLTAAALATDAATQKKIFESGTVIISNEEMEDIMKIVKSLVESGLLLKGIRETIKNAAKEQKDRFFPILPETWSASILGNALTEKGVIRARQYF